MRKHAARPDMLLVLWPWWRVTDFKAVMMPCGECESESVVKVL